MGRPAAIEAEIAGRFHQARPEMIVPDAIDKNAREQRVLGRGDPAGESAAAVGIRGVGRQAKIRVNAGEGCYAARSDDRPFSSRLPSAEHMSDLRNLWDTSINQHGAAHRHFAQPLDFRNQSLTSGELRTCQRRLDFLIRDKFMARLRARGDLIGGQGRIEDLRLDDRSRQMLVASRGAMAQPEEQLGLACRESLHSGARHILGHRACRYDNP